MLAALFSLKALLEGKLFAPEVLTLEMMLVFLNLLLLPLDLYLASS